MSNREAHSSGRVSYPLLLATVSLGGVLAPINSTMLAVALPEIRHDFGVGHGAVAWLVSAYLIAMAVAQPLGGRLGDQLGRGPVFRTGLLLFLVLSLAIAASPTFPLLIGLRTCQALIGATVIPNGIAMLRETQPVTRLGRSGGITSSVISISAAVGPLLGAALLAAGSWRYIFLINFPLVLAGLACFWLLKYPESHKKGRFSVDWGGAMVFAALLGTLTLLLNSLNGDNAALLAGAAVAFPLIGLLFAYRQFNSRSPIAEWGLFRIRSYTAATSYVLLTNLVMYTTILAMPFFMEEVQGKGHGASAALLGIVSIQTAFLAPISGRISDSIGRRYPALLGSLFVIAGSLALLVGISRDVSFAYLAVSMAMLGLGLGISVSPTGAAAVECSPRHLAGAAAGTNSMMRYLGSIIGTGLLGAILVSDKEAPEIGVFRLIFGILVVMSVLAALSSLLIHRFPPQDRVIEVEALPLAAGTATTEASNA
ncbi:MAG TPA: MFS transporter [Dehalococcoidia bacterium]|nr:MFS transporter [Dehalococcoidia bacterium]